MSLLDDLPHRCITQRRTVSRGSHGGRKTSKTEEKFRICCWVQPATHREVEEYEKRGISINRKVYFADDPEVTERHDIVIVSWDRGCTLIERSKRKTLEVRSYAGPDSSAGLGVLYKVMVEETTGSNQ